MTVAIPAATTRQFEWVRIVFLAKFDVIRCLARPEHRQTVAAVRRFITARAHSMLEAISPDDSAALEAEARKLITAPILSMDLARIPGAYEPMIQQWEDFRTAHAHPDEVVMLHTMIEEDALEEPDRLLNHIECAHWLVQLQMACQYYLRSPLAGQEPSQALVDPLTMCDCDNAMHVVDSFSCVLFGIIRDHARPEHRAVIDTVAAAFTTVTHVRLKKCKETNWPPTPLLMDLLKLNPAHIKPNSLHLHDLELAEAWQEAVITAHADGFYWRDLNAARQMLHDKPEWFINVEKTPASLSRLLHSCIDASEIRKEQLPEAVEAVKKITIEYFGNGKVALHMALGTFIIGTEGESIRSQIRTVLDRDDSPVIRLNLRDVHRVSSMFLTLLLEIQKEVIAYNRELVLEAVAGELNELLEVTGFTKRFAVMQNAGWSLNPTDPAWADEKGRRGRIVG